MDNSVKAMIPLKREIMLQINERLYLQKKISLDQYQHAKQQILIWNAHNRT